MKQKKFKAFVVQEVNGSFERSLMEKSLEDLPAGEVLIRVHYSSLNYKDALSATGNKGVTRKFPHTPGIDAAGVVVSSENPSLTEGDKVIVTSYDLGMNTAGGFAEYIRVPATWPVKLPEGMSLKESMILGTAGLTAGMSVSHIVKNIKPEAGLIAVSGATGGVGSLSVAILSKLGYQVAAITGKESEITFLRSLGATEIIQRSEFQQLDKRPMSKSRFAGAIDTVGGPILENLIKSVDHMGVITICGNVASAEFQTSVYPFILRGLSLIGIESQNYPMQDRLTIWGKLVHEWRPDHLMDLYSQIGLNELENKITAILKGSLKGRTLIDLEAL
jgi:acrylyl-CoA reductase (NADPH)